MDLKKHLLVICVNHNTYTDLDKFLVSVDAAAQHVADSLYVRVAIADNTPLDKRRAIHTAYTSIDVVPYQLDENDGYLGSADRILDKVRKRSEADVDFCIICNVDLQLSTHFFEQLLSCDTTKIGWIAPDIYTPATKKHENPFMRTRPSSRQMSAWRLMYRFPILFCWQRKIARLLGNKNVEESTAISHLPIYAGHGSIMVFTREFMDRYEAGKFPSFMYGEEIYIAELVQRAGLSTIYQPQLKVCNTGGVSTGSLGIERKAKMNYTSLTALQRLYFKKRDVI